MNPSASVTEFRATAGAALSAWVSGGTDAMPVLFLHGTSANARVWDDVVAAVHAPIRAIQLDQRGHGLSGDGRGYTGEDFAADAEAVLEQAGGRRALVVGHSMGARNAWVLAAQRPDLVCGVVAVDYTPHIEAAVLDALERRVAGGDRVFTNGAQVRQYLRERYPRVSESAVERRATYGYCAVSGGLRPRARPAALAALVDGLRTGYPDQYASLAVPMTALRGEDSMIVSPAAWAATKRLAPHVATVEVSGADHYIPEEQPAVVAAVVDEMLGATAG